MKVQERIIRLINIHTLKISFFGCFFIAILVTRCEGDRTTQNADFQNPLANPQDGPAAGNPIGGSWYPLYPAISMHSDTKCVVTNSIIE